MQSILRTSAMEFFSGATLPNTAPTPMTTCTRESFKVHHIENQHKNTRYACNKQKKLPAIGIVPVISCNNNNIEDHWLPGNHCYRSSYSLQKSSTLRAGTSN